MKYDQKLQDVTLSAMMAPSTKITPRETQFICPIVNQAVAINKTIETLIDQKQVACLGLVCRQFLELIMMLEYVLHLDPMFEKQFYEQFLATGKICIYNSNKAKWSEIKMFQLRERYAEISGQDKDKVEETYDAFCRMSHFSASHSTASTQINDEKDKITIKLDGTKNNTEEICEAAKLVCNRYTAKMIEIIKREYSVA